MIGRATERAALDSLIDAVQGAESRALVIRGEAGVGKTALLDYLAKRAPECTVTRISGVESEMEFAFSGVHLLCAPMLDRLDRIPQPQRVALDTAFGRSAGAPPDMFLVGLAVLSLLSEAAEEKPVVCLVDDAQWLDRASAQILAFVARRLLAEPIAIVFAVRESEPSLAGLPEMVVGSLSADEAKRLLDTVVIGPLDTQVRDRIVGETRGNPLALIELPQGMTHAELAGGFGLPTSSALSGRIEESFQRRLAVLPDPTKRLLLVAAADPLGETTLLWKTAELLGIDVDGVLEAAVDLIEVGPAVQFRHPLVRSAIYWSASVAERQQAHRALGQAIDAEADPDRRAWHRAHASAVPDEDVAAELERSASRAQARGGMSAAAAFLEKATMLTSDPSTRGQRALAAARAQHASGAPDAATALLAAAEASPLDELHSALADLLRAQIAFATDRGRESPALLLGAARRLEPLDITLSRQTYLDALLAATIVGPLASGVGLNEVAQAALAAPPLESAGPADMLLEGLAKTITSGHPTGVLVLEQALNRIRDSEPGPEDLRWLWLAGHTALAVFDDEAWEAIVLRHVEVARGIGALTVLPFALNARAGMHLLFGELAAAGSFIQQADAITQAAGNQPHPYIHCALAAFRGQEDTVAELIATTTPEVQLRGEGMGLSTIQWAKAVLSNGLGRYADAKEAVQGATDHPEELWFFAWGSIELIEATARIGDLTSATEVFQRLSEATRASGTNLALGMEARSQALVSDGEVAERLHRESIDRLSQTRVRFELARAHLVFGEWLRRDRRRLEARSELHTAYEMFDEMGVGAFADRAARELRATGETARSRTVEATLELTPQEAQVARLARDRLTNPEIGERLFISPRTVEYHLSKVYTKLGISSRNQLVDFVAD